MISIYNSNFKSFEGLHCDSILRYCNRKTNTKFKILKMESNILKYFSPIISNLSELVSASPSELFQLKLYFDEKDSDEKKEIIDKLNLKGLYDIFLKKDSLLRDNLNNLYNSDVLSKLIDVTTCPYCNENTTYSFWHKKGNQTKRSFDWDHVIPVGKYPFLAISFYNLIPACKVCNFLKLEEDIQLNPHVKFNPDNNYSFQVSGNSIKFISDSKHIDILLKLKRGSASNAIKEVIDIISLDTRLDSQKEMLMDILNKKRVYQSIYWESIEKLISTNENIDKLKIKKLFFSTYFNPDDYFRKPFSKITHDILVS